MLSAVLIGGYRSGTSNVTCLEKLIAACPFDDIF